MAKDPAFLFYPSDFTIGTQLMTDEQVGKYIRLLCLHFDIGRLTEKQMLFICKSYDEEVFSKFDKDENNLFFNERLEKEKERRKNYCNSRRNNKQSKLSYDKHMENENENENIDKSKENKKTKKAKIEFTPPTLDEFTKFFLENNSTKAKSIEAYKYYTDMEWHDRNGTKIQRWKGKIRAAKWLEGDNKEKNIINLKDKNQFLKR
jgi:hypothetical protein